MLYLISPKWLHLRRSLKGFVASYVGKIYTGDNKEAAYKEGPGDRFTKDEEGENNGADGNEGSAPDKSGDQEFHMKIRSKPTGISL